MKKILFLISMSICLGYYNAYAYELQYEEFTVDYKDTDILCESKPIDKFGWVYDFGKYPVTINGKDFWAGDKFGYTPRNLPINLPIDISSEHIRGADYIWTGECYFVRSSGCDSAKLLAEKYADPLCLYDEEGKLIKEYNLRETYRQHAEKIGYMNGTYYCQLREEWRSIDKTAPSIVIKSTDFENWEETDEEVPWNIGNVMMAGDKIAVPNSEIFFDVSRENQTDIKFYSMLGDWLIYRNRTDYDYYLSNDGIYFVKLDYPEGLMEKADAANKYWGDDRCLLPIEIRCTYEYKNNIVFEERYRNNNTSDDTIVRLTIDKTDVYRELNELKNAPYVVMNDQILAFEKAPVIENDFTLVPMRFLFEQMGAEVEWDDATQSATATLNNTAVTFAIDNTEAEVNNTSVTMDVPARLINGKTMVPLRFLSEELGYTVTWDEATHTAVIE